MFLKRLSAILSVFLLAGIVGCASIISQVNHYTPILTSLRSANFDAALASLELADQKNAYPVKDRVLFYLDRGAILRYMRDYEQSNKMLELAEQSMEELFTRSISKAALSLLLNDNAIAYHGEVYENIYVNAFKALNYTSLGRYDAARVEVRRINLKLRELEDKYKKLADSYNSSDSASLKIEAGNLNYYNSALGHYLSYLIYRAGGEEDNSRISHQKLLEAWRAHPHIYRNPVPESIKQRRNDNENLLNIVAFTGSAPVKEEVGFSITTFENRLVIGSPKARGSNAFANQIAYAGVTPGLNLKFSFPRLSETKTSVDRVEVIIDGHRAGQLELLEDMGQVATETFRMKQRIIYFRSIMRAVIKGIAAEKLKSSLFEDKDDDEEEDGKKKEKKKESAGTSIARWLAKTTISVAVAATEHADLRCWRTMPAFCMVGEFEVAPGVHDVEVRFLDLSGRVLQTANLYEVETGGDLSLLQLHYLN